MQHENLDYYNAEDSFLLSYRQKTGHYTMLSNHFHDCYEIYYLLSGERYYFIKNRTFRVCKGDLVFINKYDLHKTIDTGVPNHQRILLNFKPHSHIASNVSINKVLSSLSVMNQNIIHFPSKEQQYIESILNKMLYEIKCKYIGYELSLEALLLQLLVYISRHVVDNKVSPSEHPSPMHEKVSEIVSYINMHYMEPLSLSLLSQHFFISQYHLSRIFKEATGFTFIEYLNSVRIKEAQKLLRDSQFKVIKISENVGFRSISHFGRVFKEITGFSPLDYRKSTKVP